MRWVVQLLLNAIILSNYCKFISKWKHQNQQQKWARDMIYMIFSTIFIQNCIFTSCSILSSLMIQMQYHVISWLIMSINVSNSISKPKHWNQQEQWSKKWVSLKNHFFSLFFHFSSGVLLIQIWGYFLFYNRYQLFILEFDVKRFKPVREMTKIRFSRFLDFFTSKVAFTQFFPHDSCKSNSDASCLFIIVVDDINSSLTWNDPNP